MANVWGDMPADEFYASQGVTVSSGFYNSPVANIFTRSFLPSDGDIKGIICLNHGYSSHCGWLFQYNAIAFAQWGYAAFAADFPGHGRSDGLHGYVPDINKLTEAPLSYYQSVRDSPQFRGKPAFLYGESMGGAVTLLMHLKDPQGWQGAILSAPMIVFTDLFRPSRLQLAGYGLLLGLADKWACRPMRNLCAFRDEERGRLDFVDPLRYKGDMRVGTSREFLWLSKHLQKSIDKITLPFLTIHGTGDNGIDVRSSVELVQRAKSKDKTAKFYEGAYHVLPQGEDEETRNRILSDIREWLDQRVPKSSNI